FLRALHPKWRAKVTAIEESKDLSSLALNELIGNLKKKGKFVRKPIEEKKSFRQRDEKKGKGDRKCFRYGDPNHLIGDYPKLPRNKDQKAFIGGSWRDSENETEDKTNDETCLMAQSSNEVTLDSSHYSDNASCHTPTMAKTQECNIMINHNTRYKIEKTTMHKLQVL
nr:hypothetical protein [Tanacetum cinerariifolium]